MTKAKTQPPPTQPDLSSLTRALRSPQPASTRADTLDAIRRLLPTLDPSAATQPIADAVAHILRANPANLLLAHRSVAILAHPALSGGAGVDRAIVAAMERLAMSAAFQHTAMAALQNAAAVSSTPVDRDAIILAVVTAMRTHQAQTGVLLRGADLIAFHLNQPTKSPLTSSYRVATRVVVDTVDKLSSTPQGASTALLALVATARHISSLAAFGGSAAGGANGGGGGVGGGRTSTTSRFSKGGTASTIIDHHFAYAIVLAMSRHRTYAPVQLLGCELIRVSAAGATSLARLSAKELFAAGAAATVVAALHSHPTDAQVVDRGVVALRSLLLGGGFHGRLVKPGLAVDLEFAEHVARVVEHVSDSIAVKDRDLGSAAAVLSMDVRAALTPTLRERALDAGKISDFGKRIMRRIRFGHRQNFYEGGEIDRFGTGGSSGTGGTGTGTVSGTDESVGVDASDHSLRAGGGGAGSRKDGGIRNRRVSGRTSFTMGMAPPSGAHRRIGMKGGKMGGKMGNGGREGVDGHDVVSSGGNGRVEEEVGGQGGGGGKRTHYVESRMSTTEEGDGQIPLNRKWRSVSGRWNRGGRRGSNVCRVAGVDDELDEGQAGGAKGSGGGDKGDRSSSVGTSNGHAGGSSSGGRREGEKERRGPLTLSGSEMAHLSRQPSRVFGSRHGGDVMGRKKEAVKTCQEARGRTTYGF